MGDFLIRTNDMIQFTVPPPLVIPMIAAPVPLVGTGTTVLIGGQPACLQGDELPPTLRAPMPYVQAAYVGGTGTLTIMLLPTNLTMKTVQGKPMLLKGATFNATFNVTVPAQMPTPTGPVPDPVLTKPLTCQFITTNVNTQAS